MIIGLRLPGPCVDLQEFTPSGPGQKAVTMGDYVRDLLLHQVGLAKTH
jgi:hypothetical protein